MEFGLSQEQKYVKQMLEEFVKNEVDPIAADIDESERYPMETVEKMGKYGIMGMPYPKDYGGAGTDYLSYIIAVEEMAKACATTSVILSSHVSLCCWPIFTFGTEEQKKKYLPNLLSGKKIGAFGLTEPNAGTDASAQQSVAVLEGDHYVLNGSKIFITNGGVADVFVIFAMTDRSKGVKGISTFILEKGMPGFSVGKTEEKMGIRASSTTELIFEDVKVPKENLLGKEGKGFSIAMKTLDGGRIGIAAQALGIAEGALNEAIEYMKERTQFGKKLSKFQGLQWYIAEMQVRVEASKYLVYKAAWKKSIGENYTMDAAEAKLYAAETAMYVANKSLQVLGGYGYTKDYPLERMLRDAKITEIYEGTSEVQKMVIANNLLH
ncbi:acyl-CoA dehydrogenase [Clostridium botulinum]|uniref:Acyl-CoA dehydrogenase n=1 Tax=Clostridium botulinum TaxID=1491 RepID=A0AAU8YZ15_CLOBO|nr:acyl-CoA dehydrogenase [Clostridium sporogenes]AVP65758.1 acyl-CoA dehydrogenase [Clostridium botulinum]MBA4508397.1 acyl-CoA dehydrogenase [Clostridium sporogenes]MCF4019019.1 acyl-CoA dehydrogenase [Clostridium sporogenes]MDU6336757.1 acyl-CoA dehydrogenase [Clostridium sporogenes]NFQ86401.1 acyl-CoA dehydrogenase [Clostridium sporogenes]